MFNHSSINITLIIFRNEDVSLFPHSSGTIAQRTALVVGYDRQMVTDMRYSIKKTNRNATVRKKFIGNCESP